jgi:hypothetical protein
MLNSTALTLTLSPASVGRGDKGQNLYENRQEAIGKRQEEKISNLEYCQTLIPGFRLRGVS